MVYVYGLDMSSYWDFPFEKNVERFQDMRSCLDPECLNVWMFGLNKEKCSVISYHFICRFFIFIKIVVNGHKNLPQSNYRVNRRLVFNL